MCLLSHQDPQAVQVATHSQQVASLGGMGFIPLQSTYSTSSADRQGVEYKRIRLKPYG